MKKIILICFFLFLAVAAKAIYYPAIDEHALKAPQAKSEADMKELVAYLTKPYHNDVEKARSIYAWIVYNIDYDDYKYRLALDERKQRWLERLPKEHILASRLGVCEDIANLFQEMGQMAGLNVQTIDGWTNEDHKQMKRQKDQDKERHRWAAIKVADSWEYVDPTWAIGNTARPVFEDVSGTGRYTSEFKKRLRNKKTYEPRTSRRVFSQWFLTDKDEMIKTHFPEMDQWQLQEKKITKDEFFGIKSNRRGKR